jgi:predicted kinase
MLKLTIMQGLPGSGKSYQALCRQATEGGAVVSADDYPGLYTQDETRGIVFNPALIGQAHGWCFKNSIEALQAGMSVLVANTNTTIEETAPYVLLGQAVGAEIELVRVTAPFALCMERNTHGVPEHVLEALSENLRRFVAPGYWKFIPVKMTTANWG